ncbi:MAG: hydroxymethylbilane synthase [Gammaproteobacteria bacterium]
MSGGRTLRIGTRASALALWQANRVADLIRSQEGAPAVELVHIRTEGDMRTDVPLWAVDGRAFFTKEIDRALLANEIDVAVHSLKDLSTLLENGVELVAVVERQDPRDALLARAGATLADLPSGSRVGTSSLRRRAFLAHLRPDIQAMELRGNVPTRVEKLQKGEYDAIILASAGLARLGLDKHITARLPTHDFTPAVSQGAIGCCARSGDAEAARWMKALDNAAARIETTAERALLRRIEGGCQVPLGALARVEGDRLRLFSQVCALDGSKHVTVEGTCALNLAEATALGQRLAEELLSQGAASIIAIERGLKRGVAPA